MNIDKLFNEQDYDSADSEVSVEELEYTHTLIIGWGELTSSFLNNSVFGSVGADVFKSYMESMHDRVVRENENFWMNIERLEKVIRRLSHLVERCEYEKDIFYVNYPGGIRQAEGKSIYLSRMPKEFDFDKDRENSLAHFKHKWTTIVFKFTPYDDLRTTMAFFQTIFDYNTKVGDFRIKYVDRLYRPYDLVNIRNLIEASSNISDFAWPNLKSTYDVPSAFQEIYSLGFFSLFDEKNNINEMHAWLERYGKFRERVRKAAFKTVNIPWWDVDIKPVSLKSSIDPNKLPQPVVPPEETCGLPVIKDPNKLFTFQPEQVCDLIRYNAEDILTTLSLK